MLHAQVLHRVREDPCPVRQNGPIARPSNAEEKVHCSYAVVMDSILS